MSRVLLIGSNGLLGRRLMLRLIDDGHSVKEVTRSQGFDVGDGESFQSLESNFECVINLAAIIQISEGNIEEAVRVNGLGALNATKFAKIIGAMFINVSTISALSCCENEYCKSYYAASKRLGDSLVVKYCEDNHMKYSILRFSQLYDTGCDAEKYQPMLYRIIKQVKQDGCVTLYGSNNPLRNYLHVDDAAEAILIGLRYKLSGVWNCVHPTSDDVLSLVKIASETMNVSAKVTRLENENDLQELQIPDYDLFHQNFSEWKPRSIATGIKEIVQHA